MNVLFLSEPCLVAQDEDDPYEVAVQTPLCSQVSSCILFILSNEAKQWHQLIGKSGREDNISVMTLHIALNCFIGKMIVLVQFE